MKFIAHEYQKYAIEFIEQNEIAGLFLDMGMGKTISALTAINDLMYDYFDVYKALVIAPLRVAEDTWSTEAEKWEHTRHLRIAKVLGTQEQRIKALQSNADVYVINRENVEWLVDYYGKNWPFDMVVIDELSSFKSPKAKRFRALRKVRPLCKRIVGLTGTPAPNGLIDLWPQIYLLDRGQRLGKTVTGYREQYFTPKERNGPIVYKWGLKSGAEDAIYKRISDICVSMKSEDWLSLPERINNTVKVKLSPEAEKRYKQLEKDLLLPFRGGDVVADTAAVLSNKLLQLANGAVYDENGKTRIIHDAKLDALEDCIEAANGKPVLVFYSYRHDLERIKARFNKARELDDIKAWNAGEIEILLAHPASCGHGLNLQAGGNIVIWFGLTWSLEQYQQANARLHRQGQRNAVIIHHIVTAGTVDEDVMAALERKASGQDALLDAVKARIKKERDK